MRLQKESAVREGKLHRKSASVVLAKDLGTRNPE